MMRESEYLELLERIERQNPGEPLLPALRSGYSAANAIFMASAAKRLPEADELMADYDEEPDYSAFDDDQNDLLNRLYDEKRSLFRSLYRQSNVFHTCRNDHERAENSRAVLAIWDDILRQKARIAYYLEYGELPKDATESDELPDNPVLLGKKLNSLRAQISQVQKRLETLAERPDSDPAKAGLIREAEEQRRKKIHLRGLAEQKLKQLEHG